VSRGRDPVVAPAVVLVWAAVLLFVLYPMSRLLVLTFWNGGPTLEAVRGLLGDWTHRAALVNSLLLAILVGTAGTALGFAFALLAVRSNLPRWSERALDAVVLLPLISPPFTAAIALIFALGPRGLLSYHVFGLTNVNIYGLSGTLLSETLTYFPIAYLTLKAVLANIDATLEDSAFSLGARRWRVFATVTLPLATPGVANAFLLVWRPRSRISPRRSSSPARSSPCSRRRRSSRSPGSTTCAAAPRSASCCSSPRWRSSRASAAGSSGAAARSSPSPARPAPRRE